MRPLPYLFVFVIIFIYPVILLTAKEKHFSSNLDDNHQTELISDNYK